MSIPGEHSRMVADKLPEVGAMGESGLTLLLRQAEHAIRERLQPLLALEGVTFEHWQVLAVLRAQPGLKMSEIADAAVLPPATLTRHMDRLVELALVVRRIDPGDKRRVVAALSSRGEALVDRVREREREAERELTLALGSERMATLVRELAYSANPE